MDGLLALSKSFLAAAESVSNWVLGVFNKAMQYGADQLINFIRKIQIRYVNSAILFLYLNLAEKVVVWSGFVNPKKSLTIVQKSE